MLDRRRLMQSMLSVGAAAGLAASWPGQLAAAMQGQNRKRHLIVLWMPGGPSQLDTFDLKPGHANGGPFKELKTKVPGMRFSEHLPELSNFAEDLAIIRGMQTKEGDHSRGTYYVRTGQRPGSPIRYPSIPAAIANELAPEHSITPGYVSILPNSIINPQAFTSGFLGASKEPLTVSAPNANSIPGLGTQPTEGNRSRPVELTVENLTPPAGLAVDRKERRRQFWELLQSSYAPSTRQGPAMVHDTVYRRAMQLADSNLVEAFDLSRESDATREAYGFDAFGQGCLMARRLIERGVSVVEVSLSEGLGGLSWDSHADNFTIVKRLSQQLDRGWARLMTELKQYGLLESTTIAWMGEFGRTPKINENGGRDHFPNAWSCVLGGNGIAGGSVLGKTSGDGMEVVDRPVTAPDLLNTIARAVGVDPEKENLSEDRRPIKIAEGEPLTEILS